MNTTDLAFKMLKEVDFFHYKIVLFYFVKVSIKE